MATERKKRTKRKFDKRLLVIILAIIAYLIYLGILYYQSSHQPEPEYNIPIIDVETIVTDETHDTTTTTVIDGNLYVHMIDCGQGDCFLFEENSKYAMIDCGTRSSSDEVVDYLNKENVDKLEFVVGTHQHDDHMGGMYDIISNFKCDTIYMPKIKNDIVTANWYLQLMTKIKKDKIKVVNPKVDDTFYLGEAKFTVIGQLSQAEAGNNVNNYSTVIHVSYGQMDLVFTGDAETKVEQQILESEKVPDCEILKIGHHGSDTSTCKEFLDALDPEYGLISCGVGNKYNHPCATTMDQLKKAKVKVYRTDECGSVVLIVTGSGITFSTKPGNYKDGPAVAANKKKE